MSFPQGPTRVGMDTAGDMSGAAWNADGSAKIEWATVLQNISTTILASASAVTGTVSAVANASTAVVLVTSQACSEVTIQAPAENTATVLFGTSTGTCYMELYPGQDFTISLSNANQIYVKSQTSVAQTVNFIARA